MSKNQKEKVIFYSDMNFEGDSFVFQGNDFLVLVGTTTCLKHLF